MATDTFRDLVTSEPELRALIGTPGPIAVAKQASRLDGHCRQFIAHSPYLLIATSDSSGRCDVSPKGDAPGFVLVLDDTHVVIPDRPGNNRVDGMRNILARPYVGLLFLVPGREETLRVNGRAWLTRDADLLERTSAHGKQPKIAIGVDVEEVFTHCGKASVRSSLWQPERWPSLSDLPSAACMLHDRTRIDGMTVELMEQRLVDDKSRLY